MNANKRKSSDLDKLLPSVITDAAVRAGDEWIIPLPEVNQAIHLANKHLIAVLGVESFRILENGFGVEGYTGYAVDFHGDWPSYVRQNNEAALSFHRREPTSRGLRLHLNHTVRGRIQNCGRKRSLVAICVYSRSFAAIRPSSRLPEQPGSDPKVRAAAGSAPTA